MNKEELEKIYTAGTIVKLTEPVSDPYTPKDKGDIFFVSNIDDSLQVHGSWEHGGNMALIYGKDHFHVYEPPTYSEEFLQKLWKIFGDLPMNPETECMEVPFRDFPAGTHREEIWHWFDERHPKGVYYLLYGGDDDETRRN